jgi:hypothetical protein
MYKTGQEGGIEMSSDDCRHGSHTSGGTNVKELERCLSEPERMGK